MLANYLNMGYQSYLEELDERLNNVNYMLEVGNTLFASCYAFSLYAQAVEHELLYLIKSFDVYYNAIHYDVTDLDEFVNVHYDWQGWFEKFERYIEPYRKKEIMQRWTDTSLQNDEMLEHQKTPRTLRLNILDHCYLLKYKIANKCLDVTNWLDIIIKLKPEAKDALFKNEKGEETSWFKDYDDYSEMKHSEVEVDEDSIKNMYEDHIKHKVKRLVDECFSNGRCESSNTVHISIIILVLHARRIISQMNIKESAQYICDIHPDLLFEKKKPRNKKIAESVYRTANNYAEALSNLLDKKHIYEIKSQNDIINVLEKKYKSKYESYKIVLDNIWKIIKI